MPHVNPFMPLGGDLTGTLPNPSVVWNDADAVVASQVFGARRHLVHVPTVRAGNASITVVQDALGYSITGAAGSPGGADTQVQFNDGGAFGGDADFTWDKTNNYLTLKGAPGGNKARIAGVKDADSAGLEILGGDAAGGNLTGGQIEIFAGAGNGTGAGGTLSLLSGGADGLGTGVGGTLSLAGGLGGGTSGAGGDITITAGNAQAGDSDGGDITLTVGAKTGTGAVGIIQLNGAVIGSSTLSLAATSNQIVLQSSGVTGTLTWTPATSNKVITLPNLTGTMTLGAGTLTVATANSVAVADHTHAITTSSNPGAAAAILASTAAGLLTLVDLDATAFVDALTDGSGGGFRAGASSDVLLYRTAADTWRTPDALTVDGLITASAGLDAAASTFIDALTDGSGGGLRAGTGTDVLWYRGAADTWQTPDAVTVGGVLKTTDTTDSSSITTGALQSAGGLGVTKAAYIGGALNVAAAGTFTVTDAVTAVASDVLIYSHNSTGTPAASFGANMRLNLESDTTPDQPAGLIQSFWGVATHASRKAVLRFMTYDTAAREGFRIYTDGSNPLIGFLGAAAVARPTAYTQTYSTATRTHSNPTATDPGTYAAGANGYSTGALAQALFNSVEALVVDVANVKQVLNQVIDDLQSYGLLG